MIDGREIAADMTLRCDVVVVGSGPGGATAACTLAEAGADVVVLEDGPSPDPAMFTRDPLATLSNLYAGGGFEFTRGRSPMQLLHGRLVGGTSVVNSAICWRLPRDVYDDWLADDRGLEEGLPWDVLDSAAAEIETSLGVAPTDPQIAGPNNTLMARGAERLGLAHKPTARNVHGCQGLGRCTGGCPIGAKLSMDRSMLPRAAAAGARIVSSARVDAIERDGSGAATGVAGRAAGGGRVRVDAARAVLISAGALGTPALLISNGIRNGPIGERFQAHPGIAVAGRFQEPVTAWSGATQGHEITGLMDDRIKIESLGFDPALVAFRADSIGVQLGRDVEALAHWATWAAAIRTEAMGRVTPGRWGTKVRFDLTEADLRRTRRAVRVLGELMFAAGAIEVSPGVAGWHRRVSNAATMARFEAEASTDPRAYSIAISHMFGTARIGSDPATSVVRPDFRHHAVDRLYVADASVFPTNTGVNPQISIMTMGACCGRSIMGASPPAVSRLASRVP